MKNINIFSAFFIALIISFSVSGVVLASTTISTDISTGGSLSVSGLSTLSNASTTALTISKLFDTNNSLGQNGYLLQSNGLTASWVSTSSLNLSNGGGEPLYTGASSTILRYGTSSDVLTEGSNNLFYTLGKVQTALAGAYNAIFGNATTTNLTITGVTNSFLATNNLGQVIATTTPTASATLSGGTTNQLTYWTSSTGVGATSSPTVGYINTTSNTSTSNFPAGIKIGTTTQGFTLSQKTAGDTVGQPFPVPIFRPTTINTVLAMDLIPNGSPTDTGYGYAWNDICDADILNLNTGQVTDCLHLSAGSAAMTVGSLGFSKTALPLNFVTGSAQGTLRMQIGTTSSQAVTVQGSIYATGDITCGGSCGGGSTQWTTSGSNIYRGTGQVGIAAAPYSSGGVLDITKSSTYTTEAAGITIQTGTNVQPELLMGVDNTNNMAYIQSASRGTSFTTQPLVINPNGGNTGIGTSTPTTQLQVTATASNATTTLTVGKKSQNKGSCLELFDAAGTAVYAYVAAGASTFTLSATSCK